MATITKNSIGRICSILQRSHGSITGAIKVLSLEPIEIQDGIAFYSDAQVEAIAAELNNRKQAAS